MNKLKPQRLKDETYEDYKKRRSYGNYVVKERLKGRLVWPSNTYGTYEKMKERGE